MCRLAGPTLFVVLLAGCGGGAVVTQREDDPALARALAEPIMVDPDLVGLNRANSAAAVPSVDRSLPIVDDNPELVAAARSEALQLVGGPGRMIRAPEGRQASGVQPAVPANCAERARNSAQWAARLPGPFPVYPRGAVREAAGTDAPGCALRVVNFVTPVPLGEVMDFYFTRARTAGFSADRQLQDSDQVLSGAKGEASYVLYARRLPSGNTEVDLVTSG